MRPAFALHTIAACIFYCFSAVIDKMSAKKLIVTVNCCRSGMWMAPHPGTAYHRASLFCYFSPFLLYLVIHDRSRILDRVGGSPSPPPAPLPFSFPFQGCSHFRIPSRPVWAAGWRKRRELHTHRDLRHHLLMYPFHSLLECAPETTAYVGHTQPWRQLANACRPLKSRR